MFATIINDCHDENAMARQSTRLASFLNAPVTTVGVKSYNELEAATHLVDVLDAGLGRTGLVTVNVAPRHGKGKKWPNGTPFGFFAYKDTLVISTIDGYCLSLAKKLKVSEDIKLLDLPTVIDHAVDQGWLKPELRDHIVNTQFRSYEFVPRVAKWIYAGHELPFERYSFEQIDDAPKAVSFVDNFGNCPTTMLPEEIGFEPGKVIKTKLGDLTCYSRLKDVPNDQPGLIVGSWGLAEKRFVAVVVQGKSAAKHFNIKTGSEIL